MAHPKKCLRFWKQNPLYRFSDIQYLNLEHIYIIIDPLWCKLLPAPHGQFRKNTIDIRCIWKICCMTWRNMILWLFLEKLLYETSYLILFEQTFLSIQSKHGQWVVWNFEIYSNPLAPWNILLGLFVVRSTFKVTPIGWKFFG